MPQESFALLFENAYLFLSSAFLIGLLIGSFLNVVIYRLPAMLEYGWIEQCHALLNSPEVRRAEPTEPPGIVKPRSHCPNCGHQITALENIPVLSFLFLRGRCSACHTRLSWRYPIVELLTAVLSITVAWHFGPTSSCLAALVLTWILIALSFIDFDKQILPDVITLPGIWVGLFFSLFGLLTDLHSAVIGALAGYLTLWLVFHSFRLLTGKDGMGYGDFKLLAMLGAFLGWQALPTVIVLAALAGSVLGLALVVFAGRDRNVPIPFGPYLAIAGWVALIWGDGLTQAYLDWAQVVLR